MMHKKKELNSVVLDHQDIADLLEIIVKKHYDNIADTQGVDGVQMWKGKWWMPISGCDTLSNMLDDVIDAVTRKYQTK